jgi:hypothetical protein
MVHLIGVDPMVVVGLRCVAGEGARVQYLKLVWIQSVIDLHFIFTQLFQILDWQCYFHFGHANPFLLLRAQLR